MGIMSRHVSKGRSKDFFGTSLIQLPPRGYHERSCFRVSPSAYASARSFSLSWRASNWASNALLMACQRARILRPWTGHARLFTMSDIVPNFRRPTAQSTIDNGQRRKCGVAGLPEFNACGFGEVSCKYTGSIGLGNSCKIWTGDQAQPQPYQLHLSSAAQWKLPGSPPATLFDMVLWSRVGDTKI